MSPGTLDGCLISVEYEHLYEAAWALQVSNIRVIGDWLFLDFPKPRVI